VRVEYASLSLPSYPIVIFLFSIAEPCDPGSSLVEDIIGQGSKGVLHGLYRFRSPASLHFSLSSVALVQHHAKSLQRIHFVGASCFRLTSGFKSLGTREVYVQLYASVRAALRCLQFRLRAFHALERCLMQRSRDCSCDPIYIE